MCVDDRFHKNNIRIIVIGDSKGKNYGINEEVLKKLMYQISKLELHPNYLVALGDSVAGSDNQEMLKFQLKRFKKLILSFDPALKILPVIGNHEVNNQPSDDRPERIFESIYPELCSFECLEGYNKTAYYVDIGNTRLIVLNSCHYGEINKITGLQLKWLEKVASSPRTWKILFVHTPAFPTGAHLGSCLDYYENDRDMLWKIISSSNINIVFSGHEHNYSRRIIDGSFNTNETSFQNKVCQVISGGGGEKLRDSFKSKRGVIIPPKDVHHFLVIDVNEKNINVQAITSKGRKIDEFVI